jgi:hypothetical protein
MNSERQRKKESEQRMVQLDKIEEERHRESTKQELALYQAK